MAARGAELVAAGRVVQLTGEGVGFSLTGWLALLAGVWFLFDKAESVASHDTKLRITRWLRGIELRPMPSWPSTFALMFDHVFGSRHLSWQCFSRSCLASAASVGILLLLWVALYPKDAHAFLSAQAGTIGSTRILLILFSIIL